MLQSRSGRFWGTGNTLLLPGLESRTVQTVAELNRLHSLGSPEITLLAFEIIFGSLGLERCFYEGRTESYEQLFFLHANWEQQTKESAVVDGTSCCVILKCLVTSIACIT